MKESLRFGISLVLSVMMPDTGPNDIPQRTNSTEITPPVRDCQDHKFAQLRQGAWILSWEWMGLPSRVESRNMYLQEFANLPKSIPDMNPRCAVQLEIHKSQRNNSTLKIFQGKRNARKTHMPGVAWLGLQRKCELI